MRRDTNKSRLKTKSERPVRRLLREGAVPSIFANVPTYLPKSEETPISTKKAGSSSRHEDETRRLDELEFSFNASDDITHLSHSDIASKLQSDSTVPHGFITIIVGDSLFIYLLRTAQDMPKIVACICLKPDMTVVCSLEDKRVPAAQYEDLLMNGQVAKLSQMVNLMARLKSWQDVSSSKPF